MGAGHGGNRMRHAGTVQRGEQSGVVSETGTQSTCDAGTYGTERGTERGTEWGGE